MISLGLTAITAQQLKETLVSHHRISVDVQLLTLDHKYVGTLTGRLLGGQVSIDAEASEATRSCTLELLDPRHQLSLDSDAPEDGSMYATRMVKIIYSVISVNRAQRWDIPIFTGPLTRVERNGAVLNVEAQGKEILAMSSVWKGRDFKKGMKKTEVIRLIMTEIAGEKKLNFEDSNAKIPKKMGIDREDTAWDMAQRIAKSMNMQLFYDGRGVCQLRKLPSKSVYVFSQNGSLLSTPQAGYDMTGVKNCVEIIGGKPKKAKKKIRHREVAPRNHALSPWTLGREGAPRYMPEVIEDDAIRSEKEAKSVAKARLKNLLLMSVDVSFDALPIPFLEELDMCRVTADSFATSFRLKQMTIPLRADGTSSVGYLRRTSVKRPNRSKVKRRRGGKNRNKNRGKKGKKA